MAHIERRTRRPDTLQKTFLWLIVIDYCLLAMFLLKLNALTLRQGTLISLLLVFYNVILTFLCFQRANRRDDSYIVYPTLSATLLAFICFLYFFFLA
ncbi:MULTISPECIES: hypothetical protein [Photobacterium]|uniref:Membrane protein n=1 Tax=Photobacterium ganghwense TaxID=320778 RepID=A0A0J1HEC3_9GAMM|nr:MULTISPECIES: hypothetical protein [Photobacterium]KLV09995.1 membrane protein [Photobacterium ganghwense]MBV1841751.1 hypothetical protein [Photobacterium ganghwense]PSU09152.1 hypothetical protein C9I92_06185 [Photobacterium ganghwense]QSV16347.1 hypothetical protein FH974_24400 [Photobacterium ganghwense]